MSVHSQALHRASNILEWCSCRYVASGRSHPTNRFQTECASLRSTQRRECLPMVGPRRPRAHKIYRLILVLQPCDLTLQGSIDTWVATSYYIHLWDPTLRGSMDTEMATSYYIVEIPPSTEVSTQRWQPRTTYISEIPPCTEVWTQRWQPRTIPLRSHPARKYRH